MNLRQFEYVLAVDKYRHFEEAAERCFISQSTLSTMVSKLEDEFKIKLFDRKKKPVEPTIEGEKIIAQLKVIAQEVANLKEVTQELKGEVKGRLSIAVIPTVAPSLLPMFLQEFAAKFPDLQIEVREQTTEEIIRQILARELDIGILSTPLQNNNLREVELYKEPFLFFDASSTKPVKVTSQKLDLSTLCLLEEGHCMRTQVANLCDMEGKGLASKLNFEFKAGSLDSLLRFVKANRATTLLPQLTTLNMSADELKQISRFKKPIPYRTIGLAVHRSFVKERILTALQNEIRKKVNEVLEFEPTNGKMLKPI